MWFCHSHSLLSFSLSLLWDFHSQQIGGCRYVQNTQSLYLIAKISRWMICFLIVQHQNNDVTSCNTSWKLLDDIISKFRSIQNDKRGCARINGQNSQVNVEKTRWLMILLMTFGTGVCLDISEQHEICISSLLKVR